MWEFCWENWTRVSREFGGVFTLRQSKAFFLPSPELARHLHSWSASGAWSIQKLGLPQKVMTSVRLVPSSLLTRRTPKPARWSHRVVVWQTSAAGSSFRPGAVQQAAAGSAGVSARHHHTAMFRFCCVVSEIPPSFFQICDTALENEIRSVWAR